MPPRFLSQIAAMHGPTRPPTQPNTAATRHV